MGSNVEIVKSLWPTLRQLLNDDDLISLVDNLSTLNRSNGTMISLDLTTNQNLSTNHPSPFDYVDEAVLLLWEHWKPAMLRTYGIEDHAWRYQPQQVYFVLSDVWRDGRWLQELMPGQAFGVYVYCWDGFGVWIEPKFLEYSKVRLA